MVKQKRWPTRRPRFVWPSERRERPGLPAPHMWLRASKNAALQWRRSMTLQKRVEPNGQGLWPSAPDSPRDRRVRRPLDESSRMKAPTLEKARWRVSPIDRVSLLCAFGDHSTTSRCGSALWRSRIGARVACEATADWLTLTVRYWPPPRRAPESRRLSRS